MNKKFYIPIHIGAWIVMTLPTMLLLFEGRGDLSNDKFYIFFFNTLFTILNFYLFFSLLIPSLLNRNKEWLLVGISVVFLAVYPLLQYNIFSFLRDHVDINWRRLRYKDYFLAQAYSTSILYTGLSFLARFTIKWIAEKQNQVDLINQNQRSELALLRSQINPHFLFNTLNNIYSLVLKKSDFAPEAMMKLSDIMRYMLYETNTDKVALEKEVKYIESYIELMQLRLKKDKFIQYDVTGDIASYTIAPMLLVPFVENAFKHGSKKASVPGIIISLNVENGKLTFKVINQKKENCADQVEASGGIGLANIQRRLDLLYPKKYELEIDVSEIKYEVTLKLKL